MEADQKVLADPDLTVIEKALTLGRTYGAVVRQTSLNGYASKTGKGDPIKGQWRISFSESVAS